MMKPVYPFAVTGLGSCALTVAYGWLVWSLIPWLGIFMWVLGGVGALVHARLCWMSWALGRLPDEAVVRLAPGWRILVRFWVWRLEAFVRG